MFEVGKEYNRKTDIHGLYKGQAQGGISTPKDYPVVFIFTSTAGEQHGYRDEYRDEGLFWYTGEGQIGDMKMESGNKAILEHAQNGKVIHVFEYTRKAHVRYVGEAECLGYHKEDRPDREGNERTAFIFHLNIDTGIKNDQISEPKSFYGSINIKELKKKDIKQLREAALNKETVNSTVKEKREIVRFRSEALKLYVLARSEGMCEGCGNHAPFETKTGPFLECHHVHRLADGGPDEPQNVVAICPNCHRRAHYSKDSEIFNNKLKVIALKVEINAL